MSLFKINLFLVILFLVSKISHGQSLGQDSEGFSSVVTKTSTLNLDLENKLASFTLFYEDIDKDADLPYRIPLTRAYYKATEEHIINELRKNWETNRASYKDYDNANYWVYGIDLKGTAGNGISTIIQEEKVQGSAEISGLIGFSWSSLKYDEDLANDLAKNYLSRKGKRKELSSTLKLIEATISAYVKQGKLPNTANEFYDLKKIKSEKKKLEAIENYIEELKLKQEDTSIFLDDKTKGNTILLELKALEPISSKMLKAYDKYDNSKTEINKKALFDKVEVFENTKKTNEVIKLTEFKPVKNPLDKAEIQKVVGNVKAALNKQDYKVYVQSKLGAKPDYSDLINLYEQANETLKKLLKDEKKNSSLMQRHSRINRNLLYFKGGFSGNKFLYDQNPDSITIKSRFKEIFFNGNRFEIGYTWHPNNHQYFGLNIARNYTSNVGDLRSTEFTLKKEDETITDGTFSSSQTITALSDPFDRFTRYDFSFDYVKLLPLKKKINASKDDKSGNVYLSLNPYLRHRVYEDATNLVRNTVLGFGLHAFNTKNNSIVGGLFVQTNDVFGVHAKDDSVIRDRISFGLILKYALSGLKVEELGK